MDFEFVYIYRHIYRKWVFLVDTKCRNTVILTGLTYTSSRKVFHDGCAKRGIFSHQILNKNRLSLAHCALNRSFMVFEKNSLILILLKIFDIYLCCYFAVVVIAITHLWHTIEPQTICHLIVKDKVAEEHILGKYSNYNSYRVTMDFSTFTISK